MNIHLNIHGAFFVVNTYNRDPNLTHLFWHECVTWAGGSVHVAPRGLREEQSHVMFFIFAVVLAVVAQDQITALI